MEHIPDFKVGDEVRVMNTQCAVEANLVGLKGIITKIIGPAKYGGETVEFKTETGAYYQCETTMLSGV